MERETKIPKCGKCPHYKQFSELAGTCDRTDEKRRPDYWCNCFLPETFCGSAWVCGDELIPEQNEYDDPFAHYCRVCRHKAYWDYDYDCEILTPYCPWCGCDMSAERVDLASDNKDNKR